MSPLKQNPSNPTIHLTSRLDILGTPGRVNEETLHHGVESLPNTATCLSDMTIRKYGQHAVGGINFCISVARHNTMRMSGWSIEASQLCLVSFFF